MVSTAEPDDTKLLRERSLLEVSRSLIAGRAVNEHERLAISRLGVFKNGTVDIYL